MSLVIDTVDVCDLSDEVYHELLPKKNEQGNAVLAVLFTVRGI